MQAQLAIQEALPRAEVTMAERDALALLRIVWDYQEVKKRGWITIHQLQEESGLGWPRFNPALDLLLCSPRIAQTPSGGLEYTW